MSERTALVAGQAVQGRNRRLRPKNKTVEGRVELLGLGESVLRFAGTTNTTPWINRSGGRD